MPNRIIEYRVQVSIDKKIYLPVTVKLPANADVTDILTSALLVLRETEEVPAGGWIDCQIKILSKTS